MARQAGWREACVPDPILAVNGLRAGYGATEILRGVDLAVQSGEIVAVLGSNGAGKSTLNRAISGVTRAWQGSIRFAGQAIERDRPADIVARGLIHVPEGRRIFPNMTVRENLDLGAYTAARPATLRRMEEVLALFPRLRERFGQIAASMSGGEQQMLAIGRALMAAPKLLLLDEPSLGLAPRAAEEIFTALAELNRRGLGILLVEQKAPLALRLASRIYVLAVGRVVAELAAGEVGSHHDLARYYLG
jgi:branched-chain amino acid transport system ATP-binding protein